MTLHASDLILILALGAAAAATCYVVLMRRLRVLLRQRELKVAEQLGALNEAIQALETRLAGHHSAGATDGLGPVESGTGSEQAGDSSGEEAEDTAPEIKAAIAAAAIATVGPNAQVKSIKPAGQAGASPWTQQGRVLVQGSHNLRVRR